jgi:GNAT superfamily N-acetyltransferase
MDPRPGLVVRSARSEDLDVIVGLMELGAVEPRPSLDEPPDLTPYRAALAEIDATDGSEVLVAVVDGEVVGVCQLITFRHLQSEGGRCAEIESVHVHPQRRSQGIGGVLLEHAVDRATAAGCYRVQLTSNNVRTDAHRFYERHGFVATHQGFKRDL